MLASPEDFRGAARSLRAARDRIAGDKTSLSQAGAIFAHWKSQAANDFRTTNYSICLNSIDLVLRDLDDLAATLERAASDLEHQLALITTTEAHVKSWFAHQPAPADGSAPRWVREWWRYRPGRLPPHGDSEWLDTRSYLHARGVTV